MKDGSIIKSTSGDTDRIFKIANSLPRKKYYLDSDDSSIKIEVISIKDFIEIELGLEILSQADRLVLTL